jgi:hypothetical protein
MFKKFVLKSVASTAAAGAVLAMAQIATPAVVTSSPQIKHVAEECGYQSSLATTTNVTLSQNVVQYGARVRATIQVSSGTGTPGGTVTLALQGMRSWTLELNAEGIAGLTLPRLGADETYGILVTYDGHNCYTASHDSAFLTVKKARSNTHANARGINNGARPVVTGDVTTSTGVTPRGTVRVTLSKRGDVVKRTNVRLSGGEFKARFGKTFGVGRWVATATYLGNDNIRRSSDADAFRIHRR